MPTKHSPEGSFRTLPTPPAERPRTPALALEGQKTREREGSGRRVNRRGPRASSKRDKLTFIPGSNLFPGLRRYGTFGPPHETSPTCAICTHSTLSQPLSHRAHRQSPFGNRRGVGRVIAGDGTNIVNLLVGSGSSVQNPLQIRVRHMKKLFFYESITTAVDVKRL